MRIGHGTEGGGVTRHTLHQANHVAALTVLGANGDVAGQGDVTPGEIGIGAATELVDKEEVLHTGHKSIDGVVLGGDALGHEDGVGGGIEADIAQAVAFTGVLFARPAETHRCGGEAGGVDIEVDGALAGRAGVDADIGDDKRAFGRSGGENAESEAGAVGDRLGSLLKVDAVFAVLYASEGDEGADIGGIDHVAVVSIQVDTQRGIESQHRVVGLAVEGGGNGISLQVIARD